MIIRTIIWGMGGLTHNTCSSKGANDTILRRSQDKSEKLKQVSSSNNGMVDANQLSNPHIHTGKRRSTGEGRVQKGKSRGTSKENQVSKELGLEGSKSL
jgi:hypothetical protein